MKEEIFITNSYEETQKLGKEFVPQSGILLRRTKGPIIIALYGELGSGKTTFVQGLAKGLGIKRRIISPTFIIVRSYKLKSQSSRFFYHIDLYRIESEKDIEGLGISEVLNDSQNIVAIEWAEKIKNLLPHKRWDIYFEYLSDNKRRIKIEYAS